MAYGYASCLSCVLLLVPGDNGTYLESVDTATVAVVFVLGILAARGVSVIVLFSSRIRRPVELRTAFLNYRFKIIKIIRRRAANAGLVGI